MVKEELKAIIDSENGKGFCNNINLNGYTFTKNGSFINFEFKFVEDVKICYIKYIHTKNKRDFITIMVNLCNFLMGNKIQFIFYKEKNRDESEDRIKFLKDLNFRLETIEDYKWKFNFECNDCENDCKCLVYNMYK